MPLTLHVVIHPSVVARHSWSANANKGRQTCMVFFSSGALKHIPFCECWVHLNYASRAKYAWHQGQEVQNSFLGCRDAPQSASKMDANLAYTYMTITPIHNTNHRDMSWKTSIVFMLDKPPTIPSGVESASSGLSYIPVLGTKKKNMCAYIQDTTTLQNDSDEFGKIITRTILTNDHSHEFHKWLLAWIWQMITRMSATNVFFKVLDKKDVHTYIHTYTHTHTMSTYRNLSDVFMPNIHTCMHACIHIHTYIHAHHVGLQEQDRQTYIHTYVHTYIHTYIHTYAHTMPAYRN